MTTTQFINSAGSMIITHMIVSCHVGGAACKEEVHVSLETHSEVDRGVCTGDETINILLLGLYKFRPGGGGGGGGGVEEVPLLASKKFYTLPSYT